MRREKTDVLEELPDVERIVHELTLSAPQMQNYARTAAEVLRLEAHERISNITRLAIATSITVQNENTKAEKMLETTELRRQVYRERRTGTAKQQNIKQIQKTAKLKKKFVMKL